MQSAKDFLYVTSGHRLLIVANNWLRRRNALHVVENGASHFARRQDGIDDAGIDRAPRHAVEIGRGLVLHDDESAGLVDGPNSPRAIAAGAGENYRDRAAAVFGRHGPQEGINRQA